MAETNGADVSLEGFGGKVNIKNVKSLNTAVTIATFAAVCALGAVGWFAHAQAQNDKAAVAKALTASDEKVAKILEENNRATRQSAEAVVNAIKGLTVQTKIVACLGDPTLKQRADALEFCKRQHARDDR